MTDMTRQELRTMAVLLVGMVDGLLEVCKQHNIEVGTIEYEQDGVRTGEYSLSDLIAVCRHKLGVNGVAKAIPHGDDDAG